MGIGRSRRVDRTMNSSRDEETAGDAAPVTGERGESFRDDIESILSRLIQSGQVRILTSGPGYIDEEGYSDEEYEDDFYVPQSEKGEEDPSPDTSNIKESTIAMEIAMHDRKNQKEFSPLVSRMLYKREIGQCLYKQGFTNSDCRYINSCYLPNSMEVVARYRNKAFCGMFSESGDIFLSACQDQNVRIHDTKNGQFKRMKTIRAKDVGWSIVDTAFSPDGNFLIYSSWADCIYICNIYGELETHEPLHLCPSGDRSFCIFSLKFSMDNKEILGGANDGCLYVYDRERMDRTLQVEAHEDDVNAVSFADESSQIIFSGGDDGLVKVWDIRVLSESSPAPIGTLAGHADGITYIDAKGDGRHLVSNCKDQSIKLWDIRKFSSSAATEATRREVARQSWDYRWQQVPRRVRRKPKRLSGDTSLMTYRGHCILNTLVRCRFSPQFTTGQKYIYSGCASGAVIIYDMLTGKVVHKLEGHRACVRDVSWHPYENTLISTSWDGSIGRWTYSPEIDDTSDSDTDSDGGFSYAHQQEREESERARYERRRRRRRRFMLFSD